MSLVQGSVQHSLMMCVVTVGFLWGSHLWTPLEFMLHCGNICWHPPCLAAFERGWLSWTQTATEVATTAAMPSVTQALCIRCFKYGLNSWKEGPVAFRLGLHPKTAIGIVTAACLCP
eukprot:4182202-Amphidinium_carterae.1